MKIKVSDLLPNPFRNLEKYKMDNLKIEALASSIKETTFWDNLIVRKKKNKYEIAYGHHRLAAIKKVGLKTVDLPIRDINDSMMIRIMANENLDTYNTNPKVMNETVAVVKKYLNDELAKYDSWDDINVNININIKSLFASNRQFENCKQNGVGRTTILKFLNGNDKKGPWKQWMIQEALTAIDEDEETREAMEQFETQGDAKEFRKIIKMEEFKNKSKGRNKVEIAKKVAQRIRENKVKNKIQEKGGEKTGRYSDNESTKSKFKTATRMAIENTDEITARIKDIENEINIFINKTNALKKKGAELISLLEHMEVKEIGGLKKFNFSTEISEMLYIVREICKYFGYNFNEFKTQQKMIAHN